MKTYKNMLVALGVTLFLLTVGMKSEAEAQPCTNLVDTLLIDGCYYEVYLCVYCGAAYPGYVNVDSLKSLGNCSTTLDANQILQEAYSQVATVAMQWYEYCQPHLPPCSGTERFTMTLNINVCWKAKLQYAPLTMINHYIFIPCNTDEYCEVEYKYCIDSNGHVQHELYSSSRNFDINDFSCDETEGYEVMPLPTFPTYPNGYETDCYILHTPCNPDGYIWY